MRLLFRLASLAALVTAIAAGVVDSIKSVAAARVAFTPLGEAWQELSAGSLAAVRGAAAYYIHPAFDKQLLSWLMAQPAFAVFLILALVLWMIGYKKPKPAGRFAV
ncbi:hypothetical protein [Oryzifoliimicrobium ureilyticus]|uniref:hypothetical protein n=1 Tax=Oryzifoliimicrobium ureilyticus TaxID=3113724 RepID=UPI003075FE90